MIAIERAEPNLFLFSFFRISLKMSNATANITTGCLPYTFPTLISIFLSLMYFLGFLLNFISLWIFWFYVKQWNSTVVLQFNLAIADAIITPAVPFIISYTVTNQWRFGTFLCQLKVFLYSTHMYGSIYFLTLTSLHRYFTIVYHGKKSLFISKRFITRLCLVIWTIIGLQGIPYFFSIKSSEVHGVPKCINIHQNDQKHLLFVASWVTLFTGVLIPFTIMVTCYALLTRYILRVNSMNSLSKAMVSRSVQMIVLSLAILSICYFPSHIIRTIGVMITVLSPTSCLWLQKAEEAYYITWALSVTNCFMDPILYCFSSNKFKYMFLSWLRPLRGHKRDLRDNDQELKEGTSSQVRQLDPHPTPGSNEPAVCTWDQEN
ncbi:lysophosphatidic acid receptor 6-like [Gastrophryne carolinensis]